MADTTNTVRTEVVLDVNQAEQSVIQLNATASDSTQELDDRIKAKNKSIAISTELHQKHIRSLEEEITSLKESGASTKEIEKTQKKLDSARKKATREMANSTKQLNALNKKQKDSKNAMVNLDKATGGLISKFKLFAANPIGAILTALVVIFKTLKTAINSTEDGAAKMNAIMASLGQIFTNLITVLSNALQPALDWLINAFSEYLNPALQSLSVFTEAATLAFSGLVDVFNLALTPIKAIIAGIKAMIAYKEGGIGAAKEVFKEFGNDVKDTAVSLKDNFVGAVKAAVKGVKEFPAAMDAAKNSTDNLLNSALEIEQWQNRFNKTKREQQLLDAQLQTQAKEALAASKEQTKTWQERQAALEEFIAIERERSDRQKAVLDEEIALLEARRALGGNTREDEEAYNQLLIQREQLNSARADRERDYNNRSLEFINKKKTEEAKALKEREDAEKAALEKRLEMQQREFDAQVELDLLDIERRKQKGEDVLDLELDLLEKQKEQELANTELTETERQVINEKYAAASYNLEKENTEAKIALAQKETEEKHNNAMLITGLMTQALGAIFGENKAMATSLAIVDTLRGAISAFANTPTGIVGKTLAATSALATGYKTVKEINKVQSPAGSSGGSTPSGNVGGGFQMTSPGYIDVNPLPNGGGVNQSQIANTAANNAANNVVASSQSEVAFYEGTYQEFKEQIEFKEGRATV